jgi:hypothetical protein
MSPRQEAMMEVLLVFFIITLGSLVYVVWSWPTSPMEVMANLDEIGPIAFLLDLLFLGFLYRIWRKTRMPKNETMIWK